MSLKMQEWTGWITEINPDLIKSMFSEILAESGFLIINFTEHFFEPEGYTALWLLAESHLAIHTFPENGKTYIHLASCNSDYHQKFIELLDDSKACELSG